MPDCCRPLRTSVRCTRDWVDAQSFLLAFVYLFQASPQKPGSKATKQATSALQLPACVESAHATCKPSASAGSEAQKGKEQECRLTEMLVTGCGIGCQASALRSQMFSALNSGPDSDRESGKSVGVTSYASEGATGPAGKFTDFADFMTHCDDL